MRKVTLGWTNFRANSISNGCEEVVEAIGDSNWIRVEMTIDTNS